MELVMEREKILDRNLALLKKKLANVKVNIDPLCWSSGYVDEKIMAVEKDVGLALGAGAGLAHHNVKQFAGSVELCFLDHWKQLVQQARWTGSKSAIGLNASVSSSYDGENCEIAKCSATWSNELRAIKAASSMVVP